MISDVSTAMPEVRRQWNNVFEVLTENNFQLDSYSQLSLDRKGRRGLKIYLPSAVFKKLGEDMCHQNKAVKKEHEIRLTTAITTNKN